MTWSMHSPLGWCSAKLATPHRNAVLAFLEPFSVRPSDSDDAAVGWRLPYVVALILDSPYFWVR